MQILLDVGPDKLLRLTTDPWMFYSSIASALSKMASQWHCGDSLDADQILQSVFDKKTIRYLLQVMEQSNVIAEEKIAHRMLVMVAFIMATLAGNAKMLPILRAAGTHERLRPLFGQTQYVMNENPMCKRLCNM